MREEFVGLWSADHMYGPAAQSDDRLFFKADGTGRFEFINFVLCFFELFHWDIPEPGYLSLRGFKRLELDDTAKHVVERESEFQFVHIPYQIQEEDTKADTRMRVLRLKLRQGHSDHYGFVDKDPVDLEEPDSHLD